MEPWVLASQSPQRRRLLEGLGVAFDVVPSNVDESICDEKDPAKRSVLLAALKAQVVAESMPGRFVIGCDTLVEAPNGLLLEKPLDAADVARMLMLQSGGTSLVHSGLALCAPGKEILTGISTSKVTFKKLEPQDIDWWISTGLWQDRSGSFQIDGPGQLMIEHLEGDWPGVVGFPVFLFGTLAGLAGRPLQSPNDTKTA